MQADWQNMNTLKPTGTLTIQTIAMPADTNRYGDMFGGWLTSQMDLAGAILAHRCSRVRMTTIAIDKMVFISPVFVGDIVTCYTEIAKRGRTSVGIKVEVWVERMLDNSMHKVTEGLFTYVAIGENRKPRPIEWKM